MLRRSVRSSATAPDVPTATKPVRSSSSSVVKAPDPSTVRAQASVTYVLIPGSSRPSQSSTWSASDALRPPNMTTLERPAPTDCEKPQPPVEGPARATLSSSSASRAGVGEVSVDGSAQVGLAVGAWTTASSMSRSSRDAFTRKWLAPCWPIVWPFPRTTASAVATISAPPRSMSLSRSTTPPAESAWRRPSMSSTSTARAEAATVSSVRVERRRVI
mmetsp:Transcript_4696/g.13916  ORF Transcript_4696/g.13916 Transcript_4696/m.13916 type:complete len:217 (-) Transcript_4696:105-755(-)